VTAGQATADATRRAVAAPAQAGSGLVDLLGSRVIPAALERVDLNPVIERVDLDRIVERVDVDAIVSRVDVERIVASVDPNPLLAKVDVDRLIERVDVGPVAERALEAVDVGEVIRESTGTLASEALEAAREQAARADGAAARLVDRLLRRDRPRDTLLRS
jgi:hypothetical protein